MYSPESPHHNASHTYEIKLTKLNHWEPSQHSEVKKALGMINVVL